MSAPTSSSCTLPRAKMTTLSHISASCSKSVLAHSTVAPPCAARLDGSEQLLTGADVDALGRLVEHQQLGTAAPATSRSAPSARCPRSAPTGEAGDRWDEPRIRRRVHACGGQGRFGRGPARERSGRGRGSSGSPRPTSRRRRSRPGGPPAAGRCPSARRSAASCRSGRVRRRRASTSRSWPGWRRRSGRGPRS